MKKFILNDNVIINLDEVVAIERTPGDPEFPEVGIVSILFRNDREISTEIYGAENGNAVWIDLKITCSL